ncbi:MAG: MobP3 family relaxase, partial [Oscillospiraceae bacterium]
MARLILKSPYIKSTGGASGYLRYIATRERVELIPDDRPPTRKQEQLIAKLVKDFPDSKTLYEYEDYLTKPTKVSASAFITLALESNWDAIHESDQYMKYIATRPHAERIGTHGLFGDDDAVSLEKAMEELESYTGNVWTHIISLKREDAARLGFDNAAAWRNLIQAHRNDIAAAMKIPSGDFRWYAAFHDEGEHPHIHMMAWSAKAGQAYLSKEGIRQIKSKLTNDIFRNEMLHLYEQKSDSRDELVREARRAMLELVQTMRDSMCDHPDAERLVLELAAQLGTVKGKKSYGYLPKRLKNLVDKIVDEMERLPVVSKCYEKWMMLQGEVDSYYHDKPQERIPLSQQKEFRQIKNAVIQEAERLHLGEIGFEEKGLNQQDEPEEYRNASYDYWTLRDVIRDESLTMEERGEAVSEMERLAESGDMYAQYLMGKLWRDGPLLIPDSVEARYWFEQAADQGHLVAQYSLAKLYLSDDLEVRDTRKGMNWLYTAAVNGSHYAMYRLAKELFKGDLIKRNSDAAVE